MSRAALLASLALLGGGMWAYSRSSRGLPVVPEVTLDPVFRAVDDAGEFVGNALNEFLDPDVAAVVAEPNVRAFLSMIRRAEHGRDDPDVYYTSFGNQHFLELDTHPAIRTYGEWLRPGVQDFTTAAGAYQITHTTWKRLAAKLGLTGFDQFTQDVMAVELVREAGALRAVRAGRLSDALAMVAPIWASLPGAPYPTQKQRSLDYVRQAYTAAGGALA